jgi:hypothetical protein
MNSLDFASDKGKKPTVCYKDRNLPTQSSFVGMAERDLFHAFHLKGILPSNIMNISKGVKWI